MQKSIQKLNGRNAIKNNTHVHREKLTFSRLKGIKRLLYTKILSLTKMKYYDIKN